MTVVEASAESRMFTADGACDDDRMLGISAAARVAGMLLSDPELRQDLARLKGLGTDQLLSAMHGVVPDLPLELHRRVLTAVIEHRLRRGETSGMLVVGNAPRSVPSIVRSYLGRFEQLSLAEQGTVQFTLFARLMCDKVGSKLRMQFNPPTLHPFAEQLQAESPAFIREVVCHLPVPSGNSEDWFQKVAA